MNSISLCILKLFFLLEDDTDHSLQGPLVTSTVQKMPSVIENEEGKRR